MEMWLRRNCRNIDKKKCVLGHCAAKVRNARFVRKPVLHLWPWEKEHLLPQSWALLGVCMLACSILFSNDLTFAAFCCSTAVQAIKHNVQEEEGKAGWSNEDQFLHPKSPKATVATGIHPIVKQNVRSRFRVTLRGLWHLAARPMTDLWVCFLNMVVVLRQERACE